MDSAFLIHEGHEGHEDCFRMRRSNLRRLVNLVDSEDMASVLVLQRDFHEPRRHGAHGDGRYIFRPLCPPCLCGELFRQSDDVILRDVRF